MFAQYSSQIIEVLINAINYPKGTQDEELFGHCKDNAISSLGKCLKNQMRNIQ